MAKLYLKGKNCRQSLLSGMRQLADIVGSTMGPAGHNVILERKFQPPLIINDGKEISKEVELPNSFEQVGNRLLREAAEKTADRVGDATSTATLLGYKITEIGMSYLDGEEDNPLLISSAKKVNPMALKKGINKAVEVIVKEIKKLSKPLKTTEEIAQVATMSSADPQTGKLIAEAVEKVGKDGLITVEEGSGMETTVTYTEGLEFEKGFLSKYFVTDTDKLEAEVEDPYILITDYRISRAADIYDFLKILATNEIKNLFVIAPIIESEGLEVLVLNHQRAVFNCLAVNAPGFAKRLEDVLGDIAVTVGAKVISKEAGDKLEEIKVEDLGRADKVWADTTRTRIIGGKGNKENIKQRIAQIKSEIEKTDSDWEKHKLNERIARLAGGAAIVKVGAQTEVELKDKKERVIDATEAVKAAVAEGIVAGGGITYLNARQALIRGFGENFDQGVSEDEGLGIKTVYEALYAPFETVLTNAGANVKEIESQLKLDTNKGYNVETEQIVEDMIEAGVVDPTKCQRIALQHAASVASMVLSAESVLVEEEKDIKKKTEEEED